MATNSNSLTDTDKALIQDYLDPSLSLFDLSDIHGLRIPELTARLASRRKALSPSPPEVGEGG